MSAIRDLAAEPLMPGFRLADVDVGGGIAIRAAHAGDGPPLMLLHGHPQTHVTWRKIAGRLAERFHVICPDLRGYGDSSKPAGGDGHANYSKRAMAADQVAVMRAFGHERFRMVGHDRGGRVGHRLALDFRMRSKSSRCSTSRRRRRCMRGRPGTSPPGISGGSS